MAALDDSWMDPGTVIEWLRTQVSEKDEKIEALRRVSQKRREDKDKLVDYERVKIQLHGLTEYKNRAHDANMELERKLREKEQELDGLRLWKTLKLEELRNGNDEVEMLTLDKEMAEEKAELLQVEVDDLKTKVEELEVNMAIMREEMESRGKDNGEGKMKQIMSHNERMREALIKLRDAYVNTMEEKTNAEKVLERLRSENEQLLRAAELWKRKAEENGEAVMHLKEREDAYLASEEVIQLLADKVIIYKEKMDKRDVVIHELKKKLLNLMMEKTKLGDEQAQAEQQHQT